MVNCFQFCFQIQLRRYTKGAAVGGALADKRVRGAATTTVAVWRGVLTQRRKVQCV